MTIPADVSFELSPEDTVRALNGKLDRLVTDRFDDFYLYDVFHLKDPSDGHEEPFFIASRNDVSMSVLSMLYEEYGYPDRRTFLAYLKRMFPKRSCSSMLCAVHFRPCSRATGETDSDDYVPANIRRGWVS